jgi:hypothetical protein
MVRAARQAMARGAMRHPVLGLVVEFDCERNERV